MNPHIYEKLFLFIFGKHLSILFISPYLNQTVKISQKGSKEHNLKLRIVSFLFQVMCSRGEMLHAQSLLLHVDTVRSVTDFKGNKCLLTSQVTHGEEGSVPWHL